MARATFGMMGLGVMGQNLSLNIERNGFPIAVWNLEPEVTEAFVRDKGEGKSIFPATDLGEFVQQVQQPRRILMMIKAGDPVDWTIDQVRPFLEAGDILIDGGNSFFQDTIRREKSLASSGVSLVGMGVSGGETGALWGPSLMPGGAPKAYRALRPVLEKIAARVKDGPCVTYCGPDGAGHFVKMVHNGIEYGDMQLIAEVYDLLKRALKMEADELAGVFARWNRGVLNSYLIDITSRIFSVRDEKSGSPLVELILDQAEQKGTGKWTSQVALDLGVPIPTIHAAIEARFISALKKERMAAARKLTGPKSLRFRGDRKQFVRSIHDALYASKICSYAQGMALIASASRTWHWDIDLAEISRIWKGGCIIRAQMLDQIQNAFRKKRPANLLLDAAIRRWIGRAQPGWRRTVSSAAQLGIPLPAIAASLSYYDSYRTSELPQNLTQAQRDFFGAHTYLRKDRPKGGKIHTDWIGITGAAEEPPEDGSAGV